LPPQTRGRYRAPLSGQRRLFRFAADCLQAMTVRW